MATFDAVYSPGASAATKLTPNNTSIGTVLGNDRLFTVATGSVAARIAFYLNAAGTDTASAADFLLPANTITCWNTGPIWDSVAIFAPSSTTVFLMPLSRN